ncbi:MAG: ATP-dependent Clp protease adaptor ClpS [Bacteroidetes bacterium]|nr:ATP-dependent Clp protease adaptor ClpS [Bacteroidota bacterium]
MKNAVIEYQEEPLIELIDDIAFGTRVILFNDEIHSFDEVINQLIKAIGCDLNRATDLANEVHNTGKAAVYEGDLDECLQVSSVLEEIGLLTQIEC